MANNLPVLSDHFLVQYILGKLVNQVTGCELVEDASIDEMEDYPFFTFKWIDFDQEPNADWLGKHRQYICTMQIDCHSNSSVQAMNLARKLYEALHEVPYRRFFKQAYILPQTIGNTGNRTTLQGINYDQDYGFDCSFAVTGGFEFLEKDLNFNVEDYAIESIKGTSSVVGSDTDNAFNVSKNKEEI